MPTNLFHKSLTPIPGHWFLIIHFLPFVMVFNYQTKNKCKQKCIIRLKSIPCEFHYLFRSLYRNAASYVSNKIDPLLIFILLSISGQNLYTKKEPIIFPSLNITNSNNSSIDYKAHMFVYLPHFKVSNTFTEWLKCS